MNLFFAQLKLWKAQILSFVFNAIRDFPFFQDLCDRLSRKLERINLWQAAIQSHAWNDYREPLKACFEILSDDNWLSYPEKPGCFISPCSWQHIFVMPFTKAKLNLRKLSASLNN